MTQDEKELVAGLHVRCTKVTTNLLDLVDRLNELQGNSPELDSIREKLHANLPSVYERLLEDPLVDSSQ